MQNKGNEPHFCMGKRAHVQRTGQGFSVARMRGAYEGHGEGGGGGWRGGVALHQ
jgi:hypothetical protein